MLFKGNGKAKKIRNTPLKGRILPLTPITFKLRSELLRIVISVGRCVERIEIPNFNLLSMGNIQVIIGDN